MHGCWAVPRVFYWPKLINGASTHLGLMEGQIVAPSSSCFGATHRNAFFRHTTSHREGVGNMGSSGWGSKAAHVVADIDRWLARIEPQLAQQALDRGDLATLEQVVNHYQKTAPDLTLTWHGETAVLFLDGLVDRNRLTTMLTAQSLTNPLPPVGASAQYTTQWTHILEQVWAGQVAVLTTGKPIVALLDLAQPPQRSVDTPQTEQAIRGPQEAFVEAASTKLAQLRSRLPSPALHVETHQVGVRIPTRCDLIYLDGVASPTVLDTVRARIADLPVDTVTNATRLGSFLRDHPWALFPTIRYSERVDWVALQVESGKIAISVAGDPFVLTVPATLADFYRTSEDYTAAWYDASFIRLIRALAWSFGVFLPAAYIALTEVNPDLISPTFFDIVAGSHTGLPFTPFVEVVVMVLVIEVLREAAVRLPKVLATTIGTVGAIVVGTAVVKAGFVSPQIIVLMTFTALSLFSVPDYGLLATWRLVSWAMLVAAFVLGIYGMVLVTILLVTELGSLRSFGTPYLAPWSPWRPKDWTNVLWRVPWQALRRRLTEGQPVDLRWTDERT